MTNVTGDAKSCINPGISPGYTYPYIYPGTATGGIPPLVSDAETPAQLRADRDWWKDKYFETVRSDGETIAGLIRIIEKMGDAHGTSQEGS